MSRYSKRKRNNIILIAVVAAAALALVAIFSGLGRTPNDDNLLSLDFDTYKSDNGYKIVASDDGSLTFEGEFDGDTAESVEYEKLNLKAGTYTISTGTNGNPYTYCMTVSYTSGEDTKIAYSDSGNASIFEIDTAQDVTVSILVNPGADIDGLTIYPVLCKGDEPIGFYGRD